LRSEEDEKGDFVWIPFTPADSLLANGNQRSPYLGVDSPDGGDLYQEMNTSNFARLNQIFQIALERYYMLSQFTYPYTFYSRKTDNEENTPGRNLYSYGNNYAYIELYAESEAINLVNSITNKTYGDLLKTASENFLSSPDSFYTYLENNLPDLFTANPYTYDISNGDALYVTKADAVDAEPINYLGIEFTDMENIAERTGGGENKQLEQFLQTFEETQKKLFSRSELTKEDLFSLTDQNSIFIKDQKDGNTTALRNYDRTRFLARPVWYKTEYPTSENYTLGSKDKLYNKKDLQNEAWTKGNQAFYDLNFIGIPKISDSRYDDSYMEMFSRGMVELSTVGLLYDTLVDIFKTSNNEEYKDTVTTDDLRIIALTHLSTYGYTLGPFNYYPNYLNRDIFSVPAIIEMPKYLQLYMGIICYAAENEDFKDLVYEFFTEGAGL